MRSRAPAGVLDDRRAAPRRAGGIIGGPDEARLPLDEDERFALVEGVIAERHRVDADGEEFLEDRFGDAEAACGVLAIDDDEIEAPARAQEGNLLNDRRAPRASDDIANEQEPHSALVDENGFLFGHDGVQALIMRLIRHRGDFANPIGDADGVNHFCGSQPLEAAVVVACAIADAMAAPVETGERHEQEVRVDGRRAVSSGSGMPMPPSARRVAGPPEAEGQRRAAADDDRKRRREAVVRQRVEEGERVRLLADWMEGGDDRGGPEAREAQAFLNQTLGEPCATSRAGAPFAARAPCSRRSGFESASVKIKGVTPIRQQVSAEPRRPLDGDPGRLRK